MKLTNLLLARPVGRVALRTVLLMLALAGPARAVEIIAHRGASYDAPENTLASIKLGWEQKADAVEIDIYLSKDGHAVLHHDKTTQRTTGVDKPLADSTLAELRELDAGRWKGPKWAGEKIPTLDEVLATIPDGKQLFIEIKCGPEIIPALEKSLRKAAKKPAQTVVIGFSLPTMQAVKKKLPQLQVYWLSSFKQDKQTGAWTPTVKELIDQAKEAGVDGLNLSFKGPVDAGFIRQVKAAGLGIYVWTINDPVVAKSMVEAGATGITTDRPAWLRAQLGDAVRPAQP